MPKTICSLPRRRKIFQGACADPVIHLLFKNLLSINDIQSLLNPLTEHYLATKPDLIWKMSITRFLI